MSCVYNDDVYNAINSTRAYVCIDGGMALRIISSGELSLTLMQTLFQQAIVGNVCLEVSRIVNTNLQEYIVKL